MPSSLLISFSEKEDINHFLFTLTKLKEEGQLDDKMSQIVTRLLKDYKIDPVLRQEHDRLCALYVSGQKISEGNYKDQRERFIQETGSHSGNVELKELIGSQWKTILSRKRQV